MKLFRNTHASAISAGVRLHVGCGTAAIPGWINIDQFPLPGVDRVLDVSEGLPYHEVAAIYAEHFLEHLSLHEGLAFLRGCRRSLARDGILRVSTPNLDWVVTTHYHSGAWSEEQQAANECMAMNRAFHGWGHQFLYNEAMLRTIVRWAGFGEVTFHRYGQSDVPELAGLERHEAWQDQPGLPHVLIAQARGHAPRDGTALRVLADYRQAFDWR